MTPEWYLYHLLLWEEYIPDEWCLEGLTVVFPGTSFTDSDGRVYVMCLEEDEDHPLKIWKVVLHDLSSEFGQGIRFLGVELLDDTATEFLELVGGESGVP